MIKRLLAVMVGLPIEIIGDIYFILFEEYSGYEPIDSIMGFLLTVRDDLIDWSLK